MRKLNDLEKRMHNLEMLVMTLTGVLEMKLPLDEAAIIQTYSENYYEASRTLGLFPADEEGNHLDTEFRVNDFSKEALE